VCSDHVEPSHYKKVFGDLGRGVFLLLSQDVTDQSCPSRIPTWLHGQESMAQSKELRYETEAKLLMPHPVNLCAQVSSQCF
jgi:hypothetical protein